MTSGGRRRLGSVSLGAIVAANMIGAGVFTTSGYALADLGSPRLVMLAWAVGGVLAILGALCYGALAVRLSESGGEYLFLSRTLHPGIGFLAGWVSIWAGFTGAIAVAAQAAQAYVAPLVPEGVPLDLVGSVAIVAAGVVHTAGVGPGARLQNVVVALKLALLLAFVAIGVRGLEAHAVPVHAVLTHEGPSFSTFATTLMWVSLSYSGWNAAVYIGGEARDPERTLPRSMLFATLLVTALYLVLNALFVNAAPIEELAGRQDIAAVAARALGGATLESLVRVVLVVALFTSISSMVMIGPRVIARMADDGYLPHQLSFTGNVPATAIWTQVVLAIAMLWASSLRQQLTNLGWILSLFTALAVIGLLVLRRREGAQRVPIPGYPFVPFLFLVGVLGLTGTMAIVKGRELLPAAVVLVSGVILYLIRRNSASALRVPAERSD